MTCPDCGHLITNDEERCYRCEPLDDWDGEEEEGDDEEDYRELSCYICNGSQR